MQKVSEIMTRDVQSVSAQDSIQRAAQLMDDLNVGALPVCEGERLVGMVTDRDITVRATSAGIAPDDAIVDEVMSTDVRTCFEDQSLVEVMQQMSDTQIRRMPVVSRDAPDKLVGILSVGDIATKSADTAHKQSVAEVMEKVSFPSEPDRSTSASAASNAPDGSNNTDTSSGASSAGDPSDVVEVTPDRLVNANAPGSRTLSPEGAGRMMAQGGSDDVVVVRHTVNSNADDTSTGPTGALGGIDAAGVSGASGGTAGTAGSPGTAIGSKP